MKTIDSSKWTITQAQCPVTICIPVYNGYQYLGDTLRSVAAQTFRDFTVVVVDNASNDGTAGLCADFDDKRFFYHRNTENIGSIRNHNAALDLAPSGYVKLLSADDVLFPDTLAHQVAALEARPGVSIVTSNCIVTDSALRPVSETRYLPGFTAGRAAIAACVSRIDNLIGGPSNTLLRMSIVGEQRFDVEYKWLADLDFHCRLLRASDLFNIDMPGFLYRRHAATDSAVGCPPAIRAHDERAFVRRHAVNALPYARLVSRRVKAAVTSMLAPSRRP